MSLGDESLEWRSVLDALRTLAVGTVQSALGEGGVVAYTDGACIKNPGGPAGWSVIMASVNDVAAGNVRAGAPRVECSGHIAGSPTTTNNRAEVTAVFATVWFGTPRPPLTIHNAYDSSNPNCSRNLP